MKMVIFNLVGTKELSLQILDYTAVVCFLTSR